ncbi:MAG: exodeoxyribonuclease VII small subunit [Bacteroidia bacterium]|nr:exodeoxyribonuclease VII small subunit [Bacteroidia bacterium]
MSDEKDFSLEDNLQEIRDILEKMQRGISDFDKQMELFKRGKALVSGCRDYLDGAEMTIQQLVNGNLSPLDAEE